MAFLPTQACHRGIGMDVWHRSAGTVAEIHCRSRRSMPGSQPDPVYRNRRILTCTVEGEPIRLNEWLLREGWALNLESYAKGRSKAAEDEAIQQAQSMEGLLHIAAR